MSTKVLVSGIQPTGIQHIGNYFGSVRQWVASQEEKDLDRYFFVVDMHALTIFKEPSVLKEHTLNAAAQLFACGIEPSKSNLFIQSQVAEHSELAWVFNCIARVGWLNRAIQFKEKAGKDKEKASVGLYVYPILQAADILLYRGNIVPVGEDQKQHLELTRDIAIKFNKDYGVDFFDIPEPMIVKNSARIMSLKNPENKMSKSEPSENSKILIIDDADTIRHKIKKAASDTLPMPESIEELGSRMAIKNLVNIYSLASGLAIEAIITDFGGKQVSSFKESLAEALINHLEPVRKKYYDLLKNQDYLYNSLYLGKEKAKIVARETMEHVNKIIGFE